MQVHERCALVVIAALLLERHLVRGLLEAASNLTQRLHCYHCEANSNQNCSNVQEIQQVSCNDEERFCKVSRVEYLITDSSDKFKEWSVERSCSKACKNFCVTMGARTKITYCTSCCHENGCNVDNASVCLRLPTLTSLVSLVLLLQNPLALNH